MFAAAFRLKSLAMKLVKIFLAFVILGILAAAGFYYWTTSAAQKPHAHDKANAYIKIEKGSAPNEIIDKLAAEGILADASSAKIYLRLFGDSSKLKAGEYQFSSPITPKQVFAELEKGEERTMKVTIPEGWTRFDIAKRLAEKFPKADGANYTEQEVLTMLDDTSLIRDIDPNAKNLEGYLYPDTYVFPLGTQISTVIKRMVDQSRKSWTPEMLAQAREKGKSVKEIMTIASLIETEAKREEERPIVASVIYNRLAKNIALGLDAGNVYAAKLEGKWDGTFHKSDAERVSPYNLRQNAGLPPSPIASPSVASIKAALNPAQTDYIFYVLNIEKNDGSHHFTASSAEFERFKADYQRWLATQR